MDVELVEGGRILLIARLQLEDDVMLIELGEDGRDLALPERIVDGVVDRLGGDAETSENVAVYLGLLTQTIYLRLCGMPSCRTW